MSNLNPLVSVVIPTYNRKEKVGAAIDSVKSQGYTNWELIIVDDHSVDGTLTLLQEYSLTDSRIKCLTNTRSKGPSGARNCGMEVAEGKYIAFLDSDDIWYSCHLRDCVNAMENECADVSWGLWQEASGDVVKNRFNAQLFLDVTVNDLRPARRENYYVFSFQLLEYLIIRRYYILKTSTFVFRRDLLNNSGGFDEDLCGGEDSDLFFRLLIGSKSCVIEDFHAVYFQGDDNLFHFKNKQDIYNPDVSKKHETHKLSEIAHYNKVEQIIEREPSFSFKELMLRSVYQTLAEKYSFLLKLKREYGDEDEVGVFERQMNKYKAKAHSLPFYGRNSFHLAYRSRYDSRFVSSLKGISHSCISEADYWFFVEDHIMVFYTVEGVVFYDITSSKKLVVGFNSWFLRAIRNNAWLLEMEQLADRDLLVLLEEAISNGYLRIRKEVKGEGAVEFVSSFNMNCTGEVEKEKRRDPELMAILKAQCVQDG